MPTLQIDAFTRCLFRGNPAAAMPLDAWLPDNTLQALAAENNLAETAFLVREGGRYHLRWFTPLTEVNFFGHATLAAAWALWEWLGEAAPSLTFQTRIGELGATRGLDNAVVLDFPRFGTLPVGVTPAELSERLGVPVLETFTSADGYDSVFAVLASHEAVRALVPDFARLGGIDDLVVTARADAGSEADFVSRVFSPVVGIPEDPVTGSAHSTLAPYWAGKLGRTVLTARQLSARGGELHCGVGLECVTVSGHAALYSEGVVYLPEEQA